MLTTPCRHAGTLSLEFFPQQLSDVDVINQDNLNRGIVDKIIDSFGEESRILRNLDLLVYFGMRRKESCNNRLGFLVVKHTCGYEKFITDPNYASEISFVTDVECFKYIIYLTQTIREDKSEISKTFTIAHELQHVLQDVCFKDIQPKDSVLYNYFCLKHEYSNLSNDCRRIEIDACRKAKIVNYYIYGKTAVDDFINKEINTSCQRDQPYWRNMLLFDVEKVYGLRDEFDKYFDQYRSKIIEEGNRLKKIITDDELNFIIAYKNYSEKCETSL